MPDSSQIKDITGKLEQGVKDLFNSETYANYLKVMSRFHKYSTKNTLLIHLQKSGATHVASYLAWKNKFSRHVNSGEKSIKIFAPVPFTKREEKEILDPTTKKPVLDENGMPVIEYTEQTIARYKLVDVYDISQTSGKPLPTLVQDLTGNVKQYEAFMDALRAISPLPIIFEPMPDDQDGVCRYGKEIAIREGMSEIQTVCAAVHELAHSKLYDLESLRLTDENAVPKDRRNEEIIAESVAYSVSSFYNIETGANSFGYIFEWSKNKELKELNASLDIIRKTAAELIDTIDEKFREIAKERGIDLNTDIAVNNNGIQAAEMTLDEILNNREEMIRRIIAYILKDDPGYPVRGLEDIKNDYRIASMDDLCEAYFFYYPDGQPEIEQKLQVSNGKKEDKMSLEQKLYEKFAGLFPQVASGEYSYMRLEAGGGMEPLSLEWIDDDKISILDKIYEDFNINHPADFTGHSLSVSDVIVLKYNGDVSSHFVDSVGFVELDAFLGEEIQKNQNIETTARDPEQDKSETYSQVGNNSQEYTGATVAELETNVKSGKSISITDLARAVNAEQKQNNSQNTAPKAKPTLMERLEANKQKAARQGQPNTHKTNEQKQIIQ